MRKQELLRHLKSASRADSVKNLLSVSLKLLEKIDSPRSLTAWILLREKEYAQLVNLEIDPDWYMDAHAFADDYLATKFLSKYPAFSHKELEPEEAALRSFKEYEEMCGETNKRFRSLEEDPSLWDPSMRQVFWIARRKISSLLGKPNLDEIASHFGWGPGATTSTKGTHTSAYVKFAARLDITSNTLMMGHACVNSLPSWINCQVQTDSFPSVELMLTRDAFNIVRGNEIVFVPKNAKTHRVIAKEPHVNSYLQKGFGKVIQKRLRIRAAIDLKDQSINQRLAKAGSIDGSLATIDLKGASDTISHELVRLLLPGDWFRLLSMCRSGQGFLRKENRWIHYEKFSSMGNSFTFELESLIFWALLSATIDVHGGSSTLSVYGDDLVIPTEHYDAAVKVINFAGFLVNEKKSFSSGRFRESCGKDYFDGTDVRPIFLKEQISNVESLYKLANSIRRYAHRRNSHCGCDRRFRAAWVATITRLPEYFRGLRIPEGHGDCGVVSNFDEATPSTPGRGWTGYVFKALIRTPVKERMRDEHAAYTALLSAISASRYEISGRISRESANLDDLVYESNTELRGHHDLRDMTEPKLGRIHTHGWCDLGPWE